MRIMEMMVERTTASDLTAARGDVHVLSATVLRGLSPRGFRCGPELIRLRYGTAGRWLNERAGGPTAA